MRIINRFTSVLVILIAFLIFQSCQKESIEPVRSYSLRVFNSNINKEFTGSDNSVLRGTYFYYDFDAKADDSIVSYTLALLPEHQESTIPFYYSKYHSVKPCNTLSVTDSLWVPDKCGTGEYKLVVAFTDSKGAYNKVYQDIRILEYHPNPISIVIDEQPEPDSTYHLGNVISISGIVKDERDALSSIQVFLVKNSDYIKDPIHSIVMYSNQAPSDAGYLKFNVSMEVGDLMDNADIPKEISSWDLGSSYIVVVARDSDGYLLYSKHCPVRIRL
jgi:hypothetical protein